MKQFPQILGAIIQNYPTGCMDVCLLRVLCVVRYRSLRRADHSSRGVLPVVLRRVWSRNFVDEEALAYWGLLRPKTNKHHTKLNHNDYLVARICAPLVYIIFYKQPGLHTVNPLLEWNLSYRRARHSAF